MESILMSINNDLIYVNSFKNGVLNIEPTSGSTMKDFAEIVSGCFVEGSIVRSKICSVLDDSTDITCVVFKCNGATVAVDKENANPETIYHLWEKAIDDHYEKLRLERETWEKTPEGQAELAKKREEKARIEAIHKKVDEIDATTEMEFASEEALKKWNEYVEKNKNKSYGNGIITYARKWAKYMQYLVNNEGKTVQEIAEVSSQEADTEGISGFMYGCAVKTLSDCWKYGNELRMWHNNEFGYEGEGVVNPAVISFEKE